MGIPKKRGSATAKKGFSLVEVLFSIMLLGLTVSTVLVSLASQTSHVTSSNDELFAKSFAEEGIEAVRSIRDGGWSDLSPGTHGLSFSDGEWSFSGASDTQDGFTRTVTVTDLADHERKIATNIAWKGSGGRDRNYSVSSILTDWRNIETLPDGFEGDWHFPTFIGNLLDFGYGFRGIALDTSPDPNLKLLYIAGFGTVPSAYEVVIVDVSDPENPHFRGSINIGKGANKLAVNDAGTRVFVASADKNSQLQILDVSNPDEITSIKSFKVTGNSNTGRSIDLDGNYVYLGTEGPDAYEFFVIDVTDVNNPSIGGKVKIGNDINDISAGNGIAIAATDVDDREVTVIDVADPLVATVDKYVDLPGTNDAEEVYYDVDAQRVFVGRKFVDGPNTPEVVILDISTPTNPQIIGQFESDVSVDSLYGIGDKLFITALGDLEYKVYDISDLPDIAYYGGIDFGNDDIPTDMVRKGNYFYVTIWEQMALRIITAY